MPKFRKINKTLDKAELVCTKTDGTKCDFNRFALPLKFIEKIHNYEITLDEAKEEQAELRILINKLNNDYNPRILKKTKEKNNVLESARKLFDARGEVIDLFEKEIFLYKDNGFKTKEESEEESEESKLEKIKDDYKKFIKYIENKSKGINYELFEKHFNFVVPSALLKQLYETKNRKENYKLINVIKSGLSGLKDQTKEMSEDEKK